MPSSPAAPLFCFIFCLLIFFLGILVIDIQQLELILHLLTQANQFEIPW